MIKYKFTLYFPDGSEIDSYSETGEYYNTEEEATDAALEWIGGYRLGGEILHLSNPGDYDAPDEDEDIDYIVEEIEIDD